MGLDRTGGFETVKFCEIDPYCREVLKKHWPDVPIHDDVRTLHLEEGEVDVITGGFPCQDISLAGKGAGLSGERSGLVFEVIRLIKEGKPKFVILENSPALRSRGLEIVLGALAEIGYDAEWHCIPASAVGAHHRRDRTWIVAYRCGSGLQGYTGHGQSDGEQGRLYPQENRSVGPCGVREGVADSDGDIQLQLQGMFKDEWRRAWHSGSYVSNTCAFRLHGAGKRSEQTGRLQLAYSCEWPLEPNVGRVVDGFPGRVDRIKCLGNAVVPQIPEAIGRSILDSLA